MNNINDSLIFQQEDLSFNSTISCVSEQNPDEEHNNHSFQDDINTSTNTDVDHLNELKNLRKANLKIPLISHLNINSVKNKFTEIHNILSEKLVDMLILSETKLDHSYNNNIYNFPGYKMERKDRNKHGGGILIYVRDDLPFRRRKEFECESLESMCFELCMAKRKWGILAIYKPPNTKDNVFIFFRQIILKL
jgi:hypothetical protein